MTDEARPFEWHVVPSHAAEYRPIERIHWSRLRQRIAADRVMLNPTEDHPRLHAWPPHDGLAPLADLAVEPMPRSLCGTWDVPFASRPADGAIQASVLARGTRLRWTHHYVDPYHNGLDLEGYEVLEGPEAGREIALCCDGGWSTAASVAEALLADATEPILANLDAGDRLLADLRAVTDYVREMEPGAVFWGWSETAKIGASYKTGESVWVLSPEGVVRVTVLSNGRHHGSHTWISVEYPDSHVADTNVTNLHRDSPEFQAWLAASEEAKVARLRLAGVLGREGFVYGGPGCTETPEWDALQAASAKLNDTGRAVYAIHPWV